MKKTRIFYAVAAVLALAFAPRANAGIIGSTYDFTASASGGTTITAYGTPTTHTDPGNPNFCVGPSNDSCSSSGLFGSFSFADVTPGLSTISFNFYGSTNPATGSFSIDLGNFHTTDGSQITGVTYSSGNLSSGDFSTVAWNGTDAVFTGTPSGIYDAIGGTMPIVFNVATTAPVPEPASVVLLGTALLGFGASRRRRKRA